MFRIPVPIKTEESVIAEQIERAIKNYTYVRRDVGTTVTCKAGPTTMKDSDVIDNLIAVANGVANLPGIGWPNVKVMYARTSHSPALPLFVADTLTAVPEAKGEYKQKERLARLQARGEEIAKGEDEDERKEFQKLKKILGDDDFNRIMRDMAEEEEYIKEHPDVLTRPRRPRIRVTSDDEFSDEEEGEENEVGEVFEQRKDIVTAKKTDVAAAAAAAAEPPAKKQNVGTGKAAEKKVEEPPAKEDVAVAPAVPDVPVVEEEKKEEKKPAPKTPRASGRTRAVTPKSTVKTRAAARKEADELNKMASQLKK